jgi:multidrug efflux system outer membrane protein
MQSKSVLGIAVLLLAGCTVGPDYKKPESISPPSWHVAGGSAESATRLIPILTLQSEPDQTPWWEHFQDPILSELVHKLRAQNLSVKQAIARIKETRAVVGERNADAWAPKIGAGASTDHSRNTYPGMRPSGSDNETYATSVDASWGIDLFGGKRRASQAAWAKLEAAENDKNAVIIGAQAELVHGYIEFRQYQDQLRILHDNSRSQKQTLALVESQYQAGNTSQLDVLRAKSQLLGIEAKIPVLQTQRKAALLKIGVLLGEQPYTIEAKLLEVKPVPVSSVAVALNAPASIIASRPDIQSAERMLAASSAMEGVATADLFPKLSLTGFYGLQNVTASSMTSSGSDSWSSHSAIHLPIFDFGRIRANIKVAEARTEQMLLRYEQVVLEALAEVELALASYLDEEKRRLTLSEFMDANTQAVNIAHQRYKEGLSNFLEVLDAERTLYDSQSLYAESSASTSKFLVALYKALGGGWGQKSE